MSATKPSHSCPQAQASESGNAIPLCVSDLAGLLANAPAHAPVLVFDGDADAAIDKRVVGIGFDPDGECYIFVRSVTRTARKAVTR